MTPADSLIAGDTILVEVRIQNTDGLVQGSWCKGNEVYSDIFKSKKSPEWLSNATITSNLRIYDVVGNLVNQSRSGNNMLTENNASNNDTTATITYDIYWNGLNSKGMKVAPGVYMATLYLNTIKNGQAKKSIHVCKIGIKR